MRKRYIIPGTATQAIQSCMICGVGSIHGTESLQYGGGSNGSEPDKKPF